jgi:hypothetical protein
MVEETKRFDLILLEQKLSKLASQKENMDPILFAELLEDIIKLLTLFGKGMAMAFAGK